MSVRRRKRSRPACGAARHAWGRHDLESIHDVPAPAKLNLFLHVIGRRADGYHLLQSVFVLIDWADTLHFERRDDGRLQRHDLGAALPADDLTLAAARLLQAESGTLHGADISIDKRVPWAAGLGGGSSDAASTLLALNRLWGLDWPRQRLLATGCEAWRRRAVLHRWPQRLRRGHRRAPHADRRCRASGLPSSSPPPGCRRRTSSRTRPWCAIHPLLYFPAFLQRQQNLGSGWMEGPGLRSKRPAAARRRPLPRGGASRRVAGQTLRQQPHDGLGQRGVCEKRHGRPALATWPAEDHFRRAGSVGCAAAWTSTRCWTGPAETVFGVVARAAVLCRGVAKLVKASDFDSDMRGFESFLPCQNLTVVAILN